MCKGVALPGDRYTFLEGLPFPGCLDRGEGKEPGACDGSLSLPEILTQATRKAGYPLRQITTMGGEGHTAPDSMVGVQ